MISGAEFSDPGIGSSEVITLNNRRSVTIFAAAFSMMVLILDSRTGISGAREGISICIQTLIPSLFPFFVLSILLTGSLLGQPIPIFKPLTRLCRIPAGSESLLAVGFLGGYPVGAQNVVFALEQGALSQSDARRMVVLCNNAGPAFIFGFLGTIFDDSICPWILWMVHMVGGILAGFILPGGSRINVRPVSSNPISVPEALNRSIKVMAGVCGWVILFRIILEFLRKWLFWAFPCYVQLLCTGLLELSNGCILLRSLPSDGARLLASSALLGFGGISVFLQTYSIAKNLSLDLYLPGKILHGIISFLLAYGLQFLLLPGQTHRLSPAIPVSLLITVLLFALIARKIEKEVAFSSGLLYNQESCEKRRTTCCFGKRSKNPAPTAVTAQN